MSQITIDQAFAIAVQHYQGNRIAEAENLCRQILLQRPTHGDALHLLGVIANQSGRHEVAADLLRRAIAVTPDNVTYYSTLSAIYRRLRQFDDAVAACARAIQLNPDYAAAYNNLGNALRDQKKLEEAITAFRTAVRINPAFPEAYSNLGSCLMDQEKFDDAVAAYAEVIRLRPQSALAHGNLGHAFTKLEKYEQAASACATAVQLQPDYIDALNVMGQALGEVGKHDEAIAAFSRSLRLKPDHAETHQGMAAVLGGMEKRDEAIAELRRAIDLMPDYGEAHNNLGKILGEQLKFDEAMTALRRAIELRPGSAEPYYNLGNILMEVDRFDEADQAYRQAICLNPRFASAHNNLAFLLQKQCKLDEAIACYREALRLSPGMKSAHLNFAMTLLLKGDFQQGWSEYEWRLRREGYTSLYENVPQPRWDGSDLHGRTIVLHSEQGFGDTLQFIRFAPLVAQRGGRVIVHCQPELCRLLQGAPGITQAITAPPLPEFDVHAPLLSLPMIFGIRVAAIPAGAPYLKADPDLASAWAAVLVPAGGNLRVGLAWAGHPDHAEDRVRSLKLSQFAPLGNIPGVTFFSLQKGPASAQAHHPPAGLELIDHTAELRDFAETAALISNLDLIISADTSVVHLAGAMGKPVWVLIQFRPDWRWLLEREDSPWYPTARLFRQKRIGDWEEVVERMARALSEHELHG